MHNAAPLLDLALVRSFSGPRDEDKLRKFQQIRHTNIISPLDPLEVFRFKGDCYVAFEYMQYPPLMKLDRLQ